MSIIRTRAAGVSLALACVLGLSSNAFAQTGAAQITGLLTDQSGAAAPGVTVTATNQATNVAYTAVSNSAGNYTITAVPVGTYIVKAELSGFKTAATRPFDLEAKQIARLDLRLELGAIEDTVEVTAEAPTLQTETATVGEVISGNTLQSLPLNGRNTGQLTLLLPGAVTPNPSSFAVPSRAFSGGRPYVNGNREQTNNYMMDGVDMNESIDNIVAYQPSPDALAEISVETNNYAADVGNVAGAVINNVIKSGTNRYRGNVFEFFRDSSLDANSWANNRSGAPRPERSQHIFGATLGGPLVKNKVFFFANYQGTRVDAPQFEALSVAPAAWRTGDLSSVATAIRDPLTGLPHQPVGQGHPEQHDAVPAPEPQRHRSHRQLRRRTSRHDARAPGRPAPRLECLPERQGVRSRLVLGVRLQAGPARVPPRPGQRPGRAVPQRGRELEPRFRSLPHQ